MTAPYESRYQVASITTPGFNDYDIPPWAVTIEMIVQAPGGAGGSGRRGAAGTVRCAGGGGAGGGYSTAIYDAADLPAQLSAFLGDAPIGGVGILVDSTNGNDGSFATNSISYVAPRGGGPSEAYCAASCGDRGRGGTATTGTGGGTGGSASQGTFLGGNGASASTTGGNGNASGAAAQNAGGGAGGGITSGNVAGLGGDGAGARWLLAASLGGLAGGNTSIHGQDYAISAFGHAATPNSPVAGCGGGGGAGVVGGDAGNGGRGGPGCGGGSGGASENGFASGNGGNGGPGQIWLIARG